MTLLGTSNSNVLQRPFSPRTRSARFPQVDSTKDKGRAPRICLETQDEDRQRHIEGGEYILMGQPLIYGSYVDLRFGEREENVKA
jgi:hypothetical protein